MARATTRPGWRPGALMAEIAVNVVLPYLIYVYGERRVGETHALLAASVPPIVWSLAEFIRKRRIDAMSLLVIAGIVLSLLACVGGGSARWLQLRENLVTGLIGLVFLVSVAAGHPLVYQLVRARELRKSRAHGDALEALRAVPFFRRTMVIMTLVWGFGLLAETAVACGLVYTMSIGSYLLVSPFVGYGSMGALGLWSVWYARRRTRRGRAMRAAASLEDGRVDDPRHVSQA